MKITCILSSLIFYTCLSDENCFLVGILKDYHSNRFNLKKKKIDHCLKIEISVMETCMNLKDQKSTILFK